MVFSAVSLETRLEVQDLLNNFCFSLQHCDETTWTSLFCACATMDADWLYETGYGADIRDVPEHIRNLGDGVWRFNLFNLVLRPGEHRNRVTVHANLAILDGDDHLPLRTFDCTFQLRNVRRWQITRFEAAPIRRHSELPNAITGSADEGFTDSAQRGTLN